MALGKVFALSGNNARFSTLSFPSFLVPICHDTSCTLNYPFSFNGSFPFFIFNTLILFFHFYRFYVFCRTNIFYELKAFIFNVFLREFQQYDTDFGFKALENPFLVDS